MRYAIAAFLLAHGIAHVPGFAVPWRLLSSPETPYSTMMLSGRWDVGDVGIRIVGLCWLIVGLAFAAAAIGYATHSPWAVMLTACV